jgi:hypothetical protein
MALAGTGAASAASVKAAGDAVRAVWLAKNRVLSEGEIEQMKQEVMAAEHNAFFAHMTALLQVSGLAVGLVAPPGGGPVTGTLLLAPGSIT